MEQQEKLIEVKNLEVIYKTDLETVYAVNNISFSLNKAETLGIVGETGAGKTTTALSILRLLPERTAKILNGEIIFNGENILRAPENNMRSIRGGRISMIFQDPMTSLNPILTVGAQIAEALQAHNEAGLNREEIEQKVDKTLELVGIPAVRKKNFPHQFSGGMKQRVVIAIALACEPELLTADEPTTALDVTIQAQVLSMMKELKHKLATAMILITHDLGIVAQTCDKVAVMYAGEIVEYGTIFDILDSDDHHPYTEGLFGSLPNLEEEMERLKPINGLMPDHTDLPKGCKFSPSCLCRIDRCENELPTFRVNGTKKIACHKFTDWGLAG